MSDILRRESDFVPEYKIKTDKPLVCESAYMRLMKENESLRLRIENIERALNEATPETEGLTLEARINALVGKTFETQSKLSRLKATMKQVRENLTGESGTLVNKAKALIDMHVFMGDKK
jgi:predicted  nucleic acid-binding Zn-ribbon protein